MADQQQLWDAGKVRIFTAQQVGARKRDAWKVASGSNRLRMERRQAARYGMSVRAYRELQASIAICRALRRAASPSPVLVRRVCEECGASFETRRGHQVLCGDQECERRRKVRRTSQWIMRRYRKDPEYRAKVIAAEGARRASKLGLGSAKITITYLLERDRWRCGICGKRIRSFDDASLDHIVPLSRGGAHELANVQAAHRKCNYSKGDRGGGEQTLLFG